MKSSSQRRGTSGKGDAFIGSAGDYRSGYDNIDWGHNKSKEADADDKIQKEEPSVEV